MNPSARSSLLVSICVAAAVAAGPLPGAAPGDLPEDHRTLARSTSYAGMEAFLKIRRREGSRRTSRSRGRRRRGARSTSSTRARRDDAPFRILFYAQQHGDEVSGKDALLYLIRDIARDPSRLPADVDLWVMPMVNPDGAEAGTRRNAAGADLNRDHVTLFQPETQALHRVARRVKPHLAVDAHEFGRDSEEWTKSGLGEVARHHDGRAEQPALRRGADRGGARGGSTSRPAAEAKAGHRFLRYWVGGAPPDDEQRHSAPDTDGGPQRHRGLRRALVHHRGRRPPPREGPLGRPRKARRRLPRPVPPLPRGGRPPLRRPRGRRAGAEAPAAGVPPDGRPLGEPGRDGDRVPRRRGRDRERS